MATILENLPVKGLRKTHLRQLAYYIHLADDAGIYYGNKKQFSQRQGDLIEWIDGIIEYINDNGVKMPLKKKEK